ncbi:MAG TPA: response regulator [Bacteroidales bacterium]|nr:response regulator [Bacteroidales bacterium]
MIINNMLAAAFCTIAEKRKFIFFRKQIQRFFFLTAWFVFASSIIKAQTNIEELENLCKRFENENNLVELSKVQVRVGYAYQEKGNETKAVEWFQKAIKTNEALGNKNGIKNLYTNLGLIYNENNDFQKAVEFYKKSLQISQQQNKRGDILVDLINIATAEQGRKNYAESNKMLEKALPLAQELNEIPSLRNIYSTLSENYDKLGQSDKAKEYFELAASIKSHLQKEELKKFESRTRQAEAEINIKEQEIESSKEQIKRISSEKELTQQLLQKEKELNELKEKDFQEKEKLQKAKQRNANIRLTLLGFILLLVSVFLLIIFRQLREKKKANLMLEQSFKQIAEQKIEIEKQNKLVLQQKKKLTDSISYAQRIQQAVLPPVAAFEKVLPEHFILFKPRDIVSGDFYWVSAKEGVVIIAAADCTGHGVPGAFMSMLGVAFLNDIVNRITFNKHILALHANEILNQLRENVITSLHQTGRPDEAKDGMDIALCIVDLEHKQMQFAGAHNPAYIIRKGELIVIEADHMPIGIYKTSSQPFTNHEVNLEQGDQVYIFSDGYYDQIGGPKNMKMMSANFRKFLMQIHQRSMKEQKILLEDYFNQWKGDFEQVDDVLVIGFRFDHHIINTALNREYAWDDLNILIAEDIDINYFLLFEALKPTKANISRAKNGVEAVEYCKNNKVDVILMDIRMPEMNGIEAAKLIREFNPKVPIIAQTANGEENDLENIKEAGCNDYITKPINLKNFLATIKKHLNK